MAKAPKPKAGGYEAAKKRRESAKQTFRISTDPEVSDLDFTTSLSSFPVRVRRRVKQETGEPIELHLFAHGQFDLSTYCSLWWINRLVNGETLSLADAEIEWDERYGHLLLADIVDEEVSDPTDDPEA